MNSIIKSIAQSKLDPTNKVLFDHLKETLISNNWIEYDSTETIHIKLNYVTQLSLDYLSALASDEIDSDLLEVQDELAQQLDFLRRVIKPKPAGIYIELQGSVFATNASLSVSLLEHYSHNAPTSEIKDIESVFKYDLDPILQAIAIEVITNRKTKSSIISLLGTLKKARNAEGAQGFDTEGQPGFLQKHLKFNPTIENNEYKKIKKIYPVLEKRKDSQSMYELGAIVEDESGEKQKIDFSIVRPNDKILKTDGQNYFPIDDSEVTMMSNLSKTQYLDEKQAIAHLADEMSVLGTGFDPKKIDLSKYSEQVLGFEALSREKIIDSSSGIQWYKTDDDRLFFSAKNIDGKQIDVPVTEPKKLEAIVVEMEQKLASKKDGEPPAVVQVEGMSIPVTAGNVEAVKEIVALVKTKTPKADKSDKNKIQVAKILEHDANSDQFKPISIKAVPESEISVVQRPSVLPLYPHQNAGISWLMSHYENDKGGVLLADDMGLGKTRQLLTFMALIFRKYPQKVGAEVSKPILIVAPKILLQNWLNEAEKFLASDLFENVLVLHGNYLKGFKKKDGSLNVEPIKKHNVIVTNYDTFASYQIDLLQISYSVVVFDESQNIKNPETAAGKAARGLKPGFVVCCTGTPVENGFLDLWAQVAAMNRKPANPLGSKTNYSASVKNTGVDVEKIKKALGHPSAGGLVLRREKRELEVKGLLPKKIIHPARTVMMEPGQADLQSRIVRANAKNRLKIIQNLQALYQHPILLSSQDQAEDLKTDVDSLIKMSPKLKLTVDLLNEIKAKGEKVLIFTLWTRMQSILQRTIAEKFGVTPAIINGETNQRGTQLADMLIERFSNVDGFNVLILSPLAAGAGLNIVAANNVIHYGRWWNPAKEDQATDRAYRIGQKKAVNVYYPTLTNSDNSSFDLKLHELVEMKREAARDFLLPSDFSDPSGAEIDGIFNITGNKK